MAVARSLRLIAQADRSDAGRDVEPGIAFDADRLQRDCAVGAADEHIGAGPDADSGAAGGSNRTISHAALCIADIDAELVDRAGIELGTPRCRRKGAAERLRRAEDKAPAAGDITGEGSDPH